MRALQRLGIGLAFAGGLTFIAVLYFSAYWEPDIRRLHFLQSSMYNASLVLLLRGNKWGCFHRGCCRSVLGLRECFRDHLFRNGLDQAYALIQTGHVARPDQLISVPAWLAIWLSFSVHSLYTWPHPASSGPTWVVYFLRLPGQWHSLRERWSWFSRAIPLFKGALHPHWRL